MVASINQASPERVKYIPQGYLEKLCAEPDADSVAAFRNELEDVIFSHVAPSDRLGQQTLPELIEYRTSETDAAITRLLSRLADVNHDILALEARLTRAHREVLEADYAQRRETLKAHRAAKPFEVAPPQKADPAHDDSETAQELAKVVTAIGELDAAILASQTALDQRSRRRTAAERLLKRVANLELRLEDFHQESSSDAELLGVDTRTIVRLVVDTQELARTVTTETQEIADLNTKLDSDNPESDTAQRAAASARALELRLQLDAPARRHQEYLQQTATWKKRQAELIGSREKSESLLGRRAQLHDLEELPMRLKALESARTDLMGEIFGLKEELLSEYRRLYSPVQAFIDRHPVSQEMDALTFSAEMSIGSLADQLLEMIHQGRRGSFQGDKEGRERLEALIDRHSFASVAELSAFLTELMSHVTQDLRDGTTAVDTTLAEQLRKEYEPEQFLNHVFGLSYLRPEFALLWRGKPLDKLSPGERGTLLLVFYLCIDRRDGPLIIDQPEENLDNETITAFLVPAIRYAKAVRQIVLVTHNPNLAVVCDADQIVHAEIEKSDGNRISYVAGSIEEPRITQLIVDVLEGTKPAFDLRDGSAARVGVT